MKKGHIAVLLVFFLISGCSGLNVNTRQDTVKLPKKEYDSMIEEKAALVSKLAEAEEKLSAQKAMLEKERLESAERLESLKRLQDGSKIILLFDGRIKYEVEPDAVMDFEEAVIFKMLSDQDFKANYEKGGANADMSLIRLLRDISGEDRKINKKELTDYRRKVSNIQ